MKPPYVRTLRARLTLGLVVLLALSCLAVGVATTTALQRFLVSRIDQQLTVVGGRFPASLLEHEHRPDEDNRPDSRGQASGTFGARLFGGRVTRAAVVRGQAVESVPIAAADVRALSALPADGHGHDVELTALGDYRVSASRGDDGDVLVSGLPLWPVEDTVHRLELVELTVFGGVLIAAGIAAAAWVRLTLRPLRRVAATASRVTELPLASGEVAMPERVPDTDPRTEVGQVGAALNRMLGHVENALARRHASEERLRRFAADASHELRTPVAAIRGHAELALRTREDVPPDVRHALGRIEAESVRMTDLVDDLLLLARLDAGRPLESEPVDLTRLVLDATSDARAAGPDHRWEMVLPEEPVTITGDARRLHQLLANLLANARTHTPPGTHVTVRLTQPLPPAVVLEVEDDGPGVPAEVRDEIFQRFVRADHGRSRTAGGTGLGLSIVQAVAAAHGGTARLVGRSTFRITLPGR
ncbi:HAMP domain-containing sensor histidine kinase [Actinomadura nitritigenes]|uniref:histidine kinase n=1 Tax=Actinomadura nitritigenes TaxID=134602 RepID=A0ABS3R969_9ACTN|nr:HAMP domain-containing sensor histidine kinase [Actinomadura nitritigenes]MBO2442784.1 HAMP domain-containing histidine kinase [Actinomadura nitritigenes]